MARLPHETPHFLSCRVSLERRKQAGSATPRQDPLPSLVGWPRKTEGFRTFRNLSCLPSLKNRQLCVRPQGQPLKLAPLDAGLLELGETASWKPIQSQGGRAVLVDSAETAGRGPYRGGAHSDISGPRMRGDGLDSHHMPDRHANPSVHPNSGPAIQMDPIDHHATLSNGRHGAAGARFRAETARMIREGRYRDAMSREISDVRRAANEVSNNPRKYTGAIQEMLDYARESGQLPGKN
jgi:hypothetical protein